MCIPSAGTPGEIIGAYVFIIAYGSSLKDYEFVRIISREVTVIQAPLAHKDGVRVLPGEPRPYLFHPCVVVPLKEAQPQVLLCPNR